jgi:hypothetical protein
LSHLAEPSIHGAARHCRHDGAFFLGAKRTHGCFGFAVRVETEQLSFRLSAMGTRGRGPCVLFFSHPWLVGDDDALDASLSVACGDGDAEEEKKKKWNIFCGHGLANKVHKKLIKFIHILSILFYLCTQFRV